jgi:MFS family permease
VEARARVAAPPTVDPPPDGPDAGPPVKAKPAARRREILRSLHVRRPSHSAAALARAFRALHVRNYRLYFAGQLVSQTGTWMQNIAQAWLVLELTGSALALGTVTALQFVPVLVLSLPGGMLADRVPRRRLLIVTQTLAMLQAFVLAALVVTSTIQVWHVYVLAALLGVANALGQPSQRTLPSDLVPPDLVHDAVALNSALFNLARVAGPAAGGLTLELIGTEGCFLLNAVSFLFVIAALVMIQPSEMYTRAPNPTGWALPGVAEAFTYVRHTPEVAFLLTLVGFLGTFGYNFNVVLPLLARYELGAGPIVLGLFNACLGLGSIAGALLVAVQEKPALARVTLAALGFSTCLALLAALPWWQLTVALLLAQGLAGVAFSAGANTTLQVGSPSPLRGRIMSFYTLLFTGTTPIGASLNGLLADRWDVRVALGADSALCLLGVLLGLAYLRYRRARPAPSPPATAGAPAASPA